jgi:hypothetical protein
MKACPIRKIEFNHAIAEGLKPIEAQFILPETSQEAHDLLPWRALLQSHSLVQGGRKNHWPRWDATVATG